MKKNNILTRLQQRAQDQYILHDVPFSGIFLLVSRLLGENPWRIIIPFSFLITVLLQLFLGKAFDEYILGIFFPL